MLKLLLKKQLLEIFRVYFYDAKKNKARSKNSTVMHFVLFILLVFGLLGGGFTFLATKLCTSLVAVGLDWLYFALMGLIAVLLGAFGSVFNTYAGLYLPKDNDLLLSMPIPVSVLVAARLSGVYLMGLLYSAIVILPAIIVYWVIAGITLPVASAVSSGGTLADFSGKNQDAASFNRFAAAPVHSVHGSSLSYAFAAAVDDSSFFGFLCAAHGTDWSVPWSQNADIDMDE